MRRPAVLKTGEAGFISILLALSLPRCADTKGILTEEDIPADPRPPDKIPPAIYLWITTDHYYKGGEFGGVDGATVKCEEDTAALGNLPDGPDYYHRAVIVDSDTRDRDLPQNWPISGKDRDILRNVRIPVDTMTKIADNYDAVFNTDLGVFPLEAGVGWGRQVLLDWLTMEQPRYGRYGL